MKKTLTLLFSFIFLFLSIGTLPASAAYNKEIDFDANIVYLESLDQGTVIFDKNANLRTAEASLTKITTAIVVLDNCKDLDAVVTTSSKVMDTLVGTNSSAAGITVGEKLTVRQLLSLMLIKSANEAASILADYVGGDIDTFVGMMNDFAKARGCKNTHYTNPHGLDDPNHYTTAADLAKIIKYALKNKTFCEIVASPSYTLPKTNKRESVKYSNTNLLLMPRSSYYYEPCKGIKTGTTENAGKCLASYAVKNGYTYLCIVMQAPHKDSNGDGMKDNYALIDTVKAYEWAFNNIKLKVVADPSTIGPIVDVKLAKKVDHVRLVPKEEVSALIPSNVDVSAIYIEPIKNSIDPNLKAPIKAGEVLGKANVKYAGDTLCKIDLVAGEDVKMSVPLYIGYLLKKLFTSTAMKIILAILGVLLLIYIVVNVIYSNKKKKKHINMVRYDIKPGQKFSLNENPGNKSNSSHRKR